MTATRSGDGTDFEDWLEEQFSRTLGPERGQRPLPSQARYGVASRGIWRRFVAIRSSVLAAIGTKAVAGGAVVALAAGGAAAAVKTTGSMNPADWGRGVVQAVQVCKDDVRGNTAASSSRTSQGIGHCVSKVARQHGKEQRAQHAGGAPKVTPGSPSPLPGERVGQQNGQSPGNGNGATHGQGAAHGQGQGAGQTTGHGHGQPRPTPSPHG
jgi:hypothetical protein